MAAKKKSKSEELKFEDALARLEEIVGRLEQGDAPLEEALDLFADGVALGRRCDEQLKEAERKISLLVERADGSLAEEPLDAPAAPDAADDGGDDEDDDGIPF